jgi:hypothetical protein
MTLQQSCGKSLSMTRREPCPAGLLQRGLTIVLLGYALAIQLFVGAYFQQKMTVGALEGHAVICSSLVDLGFGEHPADDQDNAHCLALCQLACGAGPALADFLRDVPAHQPVSLAIRWEGRASHAAVPALYHAPQARGPPPVSFTL